MEVVMPKMGESINEGTIIKWHKKVGDHIVQDEIIFEISTDKVDTEIPSPANGILKEIKFQEGDTVDVGTVVAILDTTGAAAVSPLKEVLNNSADAEAKIEIIPEAVPKIIAASSPPKIDSSSNKTVDVTMPKMGESVMEGTILKWHKKMGDKIEKDEILFEISTDKVDTEVPSSEAGIVAEILIGEQETVEVGTVVAKITMEGSFVQTRAADETKTVFDKKIEQPAQMHDNFGKLSTDKISNSFDKTGKFYSPLVMSIANKENVNFNELEKIKGTGQGGRVTKKDILEYISFRTTEKGKQKINTGAASVPSPLFTSNSSGAVERIEMGNIRQKIMQHMVRSRDTSVHVSAMIEVDMAKVYNFIKDKKDEYLKREGIKLTYMAFIGHAAVKALKEYSLVNSTIEGTTILKKKYINLGIAVAIEPTGLIVPNIKNAGEKNIVGIGKSIADVAARARNKKLTPDDISNGTFTITNYGVFGTIFGTPIINQPEVAILGVGVVEKKPVVVEVDGTDYIAIKPMMALTLSHDHRLIDGMLGGMFLKHIKDTLENFEPGIM